MQFDNATQEAIRDVYDLLIEIEDVRAAIENARGNPDYPNLQRFDMEKVRRIAEALTEKTEELDNELAEMQDKINRRKERFIPFA